MDNKEPVIKEVSPKFQFFLGRSKKSKRYKKAKKYILKNKKNYIWTYFIVFLFFFMASLLGNYTGTVVLPSTNVGLKDLSTIIGVLAAGVVSLVISEKNRENEENKHREKWCSELRNHYSFLSAAVNSFSRNMARNIDSKNMTAKDIVLKLRSNINRSRSEYNEIARMHHVLALYLLSEERLSPKYKVFMTTERFRKRLHVRVSKIYNLAKKIELERKDEEDLVDSDDCSKAIEEFKEARGKELVNLNFCVKVYLDYEWGKQTSRSGSSKLMRFFLYSLLFFLINTFCSFVWVNSTAVTQ